MANVTYTVPNKSGSYDGDMVVKQYSSMTINTGDFVTTDQPCRGLMILVQGNCTINGTLSMTGRGGYSNPTTNGGSDSNTVDANGLRMPFATSGGSSSLTASNTLFNGCGNGARSVLANFKTIASSGDVITLSRQGANGGSAPGSQQNNGAAGSNGGTGQTGGGGAGARGWTGPAGAGSYGSCFAGGSGGGGSNGNSESSGAGNAWGGPGGNGATDHSAATSGGVGNPAGGNDTTSGSANNSESGTGGLIILIVGGNLTIGSNGSIVANGNNSGNCSGGNQWHGSGGASGGGNIVIAHRGSYTNNGSVTANGGTSGTIASYQYAKRGGNGGNGSIQTLQVL